MVALLAVVALAAQVAVPAVHQLHDHWAAAQVDQHHAHAHHGHHHHGDAHHDHEEEDHDGSQCPTCQLFTSLRAYVPLTSPVVIVSDDAVAVGWMSVPPAAPVAAVDLTEACPRAPPVC